MTKKYNNCLPDLTKQEGIKMRICIDVSML